MKKHIMLILTLCTSLAYAARNDWPYDGIFIVNNSEGDLAVQWNGNRSIIRRPQPACINKMFIPAPLRTVISISYLDHTDDRNLPSCRGKKQLSFKTNKNTVLYEITGGFKDDIGEFNNTGTGIHCIIKISKQLNARAALKKYPDLE